MLWYGVCIGPDVSRYERFARRGLDRLGVLNRTIELRGERSIFSAYNKTLDRVAQLDVSGLVLLHDDFELLDEQFELKVKQLLEEDVAVIGAIGGVGIRGVRWSQAVETFGRMPDAQHGDNDFGGGTHDVDLVDGCLLVMSSWAVKHLRFDEDRFDGWHGYDADICMQARVAGKRVRVAEFKAFHHTRSIPGTRAHLRADRVFRDKWGFQQDPVRRRLGDWCRAIRLRNR